MSFFSRLLRQCRNASFRGVWKLVAGVLVVFVAFGLPLSRVAPMLNTVPEVQALENIPDGLSAQIQVPICGPIVAGTGGVLCTDYGQYKLTQEKIQNKISHQLMISALVSTFSALTHFTQRIAYDTAEWMSNGFQGQAPGIYTSEWDTYVGDLALDSLGDFMGTFSEEFTKGAFGLDLCAPPHFPDLALEFTLGLPGLLNAIERPAPKCSWSQVTQNWSQAKDSLSNVESIQNIRSNFTTGGNDISFGIGAHLAFFDAVAGARTAGIQERLEGQGFKSVSNFVSGNIETPAQAVKRTAEFQLIEAPTHGQNVQASALLNNAFEIGITQLGVITASTFTNVLLSRLLAKAADGLFKSSGSDTPNFLLDPNLAPPGSVDPQSIFASQYSDLKTPHIIRPEAQDILADLTACPTDGRSKWNCSMDEGLAVALRQDGGLTVRQAIDQGFLNPNWELIPSLRARDNQDPTCHSYAFCVSNLRKLRLARVIPVGWELAADSAANQLRCTQSEGCVTLGEAITRFDDCNDEGALDATHPFCHLVDPNWVLTLLPAQCQVQGFGNQLISGTSQRLSECQDTTSCLRRDVDGSCIGGYGYCMAEQTFWQFDAPKCAEQYASCRSYTLRGQGKPVSYLRATLDYGSCDATNVGCMWYALYRNPDPASGDSAWMASIEESRLENGFLNRIYLDKNVAPCDASNDGCTALLEIEEGQAAVNLLENGSFEETLANSAFPAAWVTSTNAGSYVPPDVNGVPHGQTALLADAALGTTVVSDRRVAAKPFHQYVISFAARRFGGAVSAAGVHVRQYLADGVQEVTEDGTVYAQSAGCAPLTGTRRGASAAGVGEEWERFSCSFVTSAETRYLRVFISTDAGAPLIDVVQLEEGERPRPFINGLNTALTQINMKVPPEELACSGNPETDHPLCANFAPVCRQTEAGCQGYRPTDGGTDTEIPAVLSAADRCPSECVGYSEYRKQPSTFDLTRNTDPALDDPEDDTSAFFVPRSAQSCSVQDVGCEVFTNLDPSGEATQAYRYLRACELPGTDSQTYYTWEGSDTSGYQLKTWSLKRDATAFPQGPKVLVKAGPSGTRKDPAACNANSYLSGFDPDCRQFYDPEGNVFYRFESQTVLSSDQCIQLRKEGSTRADCEKTGGTFNPVTAQCVYRAHPGSSVQCAATYAGCRAYVGTQGRAQQELFYEEFTSDTFQVTGVDVGGTPRSSIALSDESVLVGDQSLRVQPVGNAATLFVGPMPLEEGALYEVSFWAKATVPNNATLTVQAGNGAPVAANASVVIGPDWRTYRMGPFALPADVVSTGVLSLSIQGSPLAFIDKIRVERVRDVTYVVKDSWNTPASCDRTAEGIPSSQAMLGCRAYTDRNGAEVTVRQFTRLCRETAISCTAYVDTRNTPTPYAQTWTRPSSSEVLPVERTRAPEDRFVYLVDTPAARCQEDALGCRAFGRPNYTQDRLALTSNQPFTNVYLIDNPANYDEAICSETALFCEAFTYATDRETGTSYFRAPADHACEYREAAVVPDGTVPGLLTSGQVYDGWFRIGTDEPCAPDLLQSGNLFGIRYTGDVGFNAWAAPDSYPDGTGYRGWTGLCPQSAAECTELRDVNDKSDQAHPLGRPYFVVNNSQLDTDSCNGRVDPGDGCVLFRDTSNPNLTASTAATYDLYKTRAYQAIDPVDCVLTPDHPSCVATGSTTNDANTVIRVQPDRACSAWLACTTAETVFDPQDGTYKSICSDLSLCSVAGRQEGDSVPFCGNYVDRSNVDQTILTEFTVLSAAQYAARPTGFGAQDYSGSAIPDQFQVMDTVSLPIGSLLSLDPIAQSRLAKDYRLAVGVPIRQTGSENGLPVWEYGAAPVSILGGAIADPVRQFADLFPYACMYKAPGGSTTFTQNDANVVSYGVITDQARALSSSANGTTCWLTIDQARPAQLTQASGAALVSDNLNLLALIGRLEQITTVTLSGSGSSGAGQAVDRGLPGAQCKAAPESDSPFDNRFVVDWDATVAPPTPGKVREGYRSVNFCEYGEDCSCTYKRVNYGGTYKFYEPTSVDVVNAICVGGPRDGRPCTVNSAITGSVPPAGVETVGTGDDAVSVDVGALLRGEYSGIPDTNTTCGQGGTCRAIQAISLVRGVTGQCLQYDTSRPLVGSRSEYECLVWNPNPLFIGPADPYHWTPSAGFQPPQTSGRYYCLSPYRSPRTIAFQPEVRVDNEDLAENRTIRDPIGFLKNTVGTYAGQIKLFWYTDGVTSDRSCELTGIARGVSYAIPAIGAAIDVATSQCNGNAGGGSLDGALASGTDMGRWCEEADDDQSDLLATAADFRSVRLVTTGKGSGRGYAEYAVLANWEQVGLTVAGYSSNIPPSAVDREILLENSTEDAISGFTFNTPTMKLGCAYSEDWVDGVSGIDYDEPDSWRPMDNKWQSGFRSELMRNGGRLDRRTAQILTEEGNGEGTPIKIECNNPENEPEDLSGCYIKTWTLDYRAEGQNKFVAFDPDISRQSMDALSKAPVFGKCESDRSWFSIRAVFENTSDTENNKSPEQVNPETLTGPFQFVGFWVTACSPQSGPRYIYMSVDLDTADICRELGETISKDTQESAAFTDRNWAFGSFSVPKLGYQWESTSVPFGASLATRTAGEDPLYMTGVKQAQSNVLNPPTFTYSGQTYYVGETYPRSNWGVLSNIFARIYRIYGYNAREVSRDDWACTDPNSPNFGQWCPSDDDSISRVEHQALSRKYCGYEATCVGVGFDGADLFAERLCNSYSGVNRGLNCSSDPDICHAGPAQLGVDGVLRTQFTACEANTADGWVQAPGGNWRCPSGAACEATPEGRVCQGEAGCGLRTAISGGVFRCAANSALAPGRPGVSGNLSYCTAEKEVSAECPLYVAPQPCINQDAEGYGVCQGYEWAQCQTANDCVFKAQNYWPAGGVANNTYDYAHHTKYNPRFTNDSRTNIADADPRYAYMIGGRAFGSLNEDCPGLNPAQCLMRAAFAPVFPATGHDSNAAYDDQANFFFGQRVDGLTVSGSGNFYADPTPSGSRMNLLRLYPGVVPYIGQREADDTGLDSTNYIHFSDASSDTTPRPLVATNLGDAPFIDTYHFQRADPGDSYQPSTLDRLIVHAAACEPKALMKYGHYGAYTPWSFYWPIPETGSAGNRVGVCRGGVRAGNTCYADNDCVPAGVGPTTGNDWCNPVTAGEANNWVGSPPNAACWTDWDKQRRRSEGSFTALNRPGREDDPALDNNICTHPAGYWPQPNVCPDPDDEYCGLLWYDLRTPFQSVNDDALLPTDVTTGLYAPNYRSLGGTNVSSNNADYSYISYYNPVPPMIAAPDMRTCEGGTCKVSSLGSFSIDSRTEGTVVGGSGNHIATARFYAWAAHEQMPLRQLVVDWGDGKETQLPDAFMKNHKPYCGAVKECGVAIDPNGSTGLTCQGDADCPPGTGSCLARGNCANGPRVGQACFTDAQCDSSQGNDGVCQPRVFFGNDDDACEEQFYEFRHVYDCGADAEATLPACPRAGDSFVGRCSGDQNRICSNDGQCAAGDRCLGDAFAMAPVGGCFDAASRSCRFTPRILTKDNWGWCGGECRAVRTDQGVMQDASDARTLHPNGGCYDASLLRSNVSLAPLNIANECQAVFPNGGTARPWFIFPGVIQLVTGIDR